MNQSLTSNARGEGALTFCHVQFGHAVWREPIRAQAAVLVHCVDEAERIAEAEDDTLESESISDVLDRKAWVLRKNGGANCLR